MITKEDLYKNEPDCCGCGSCADVCPRSVLSMKADRSGFFYPVIGDAERCIDCGRCLSVCPQKNVEAVSSAFTDFYAGYLEDEKELVSCASGGLATALSEKFIRGGGVVYGCAYSEDFRRVEYVRAACREEIGRLKTSKYAQSLKGNVYSRILADLESGTGVLFIGLPCDVLAVRIRVPEKLREKLFLVELVCHGPTSQEVHRQYLDRAAEKKGPPVYFSAREKKNGEWKPFYICVKSKGSGPVYEPFHTSSYGAAFRYLKRPSCYTCRIKGEHLAGDLMIGDYHYVEKGMKGWNRHGVSSALVHNQKGRSLLEGLGEAGFFLTEIDGKGALGSRAVREAVRAPRGQARFRQVFESRGLVRAAGLGFVRRSNIRRAFRETFLRRAVAAKRFFIPSSRPRG